MTVEAPERDKLERLCRHIARPRGAAQRALDGRYGRPSRVLQLCYGEPAIRRIRDSHNPRPDGAIRRQSTAIRDGDPGQPPSGHSGTVMIRPRRIVLCRIVRALTALPSMAGRFRSLTTPSITRTHYGKCPPRRCPARPKIHPECDSGGCSDCRHRAALRWTPR